MSIATLIVAVVVLLAAVYMVRQVRGIFKGTVGCCGGSCSGNCNSCQTTPGKTADIRK